MLVVFAIAEIAYTQTFPSLHGQRYGPDLFPRLIGVALIASGLLLIIRGIASKRRASVEPHAVELHAIDGNSADTHSSGDHWLEAGPWLKQSHLKLNLLLVLLALIGYILFSNFLGFIISSMLILTVLLYRFGSSILLSVLIATATTAVLHFTFAKLLLVPLPAGLLQGLVY